MAIVNRHGVRVSPPTPPPSTSQSRPPPPHTPKPASTMSKTITPLDKDWFFKRASDPIAEFRSVASVPSEIFVDLLAHDMIPDPFLNKNETEVQWVGEEDWIYAVIFPEPASTPHKAHTHLVFEGLDTYATATLNGIEILRTDNMFTPARIDITPILKQGQNELIVLFESALARGKQTRKEWPDFEWACWNGDASRLAVRKAQYHYVCALFFPREKGWKADGNRAGIGAQRCSLAVRGSPCILKRSRQKSMIYTSPTTSPRRPRRQRST